MQTKSISKNLTSANIVKCAECTRPVFTPGGANFRVWNATKQHVSTKTKHVTILKLNFAAPLINYRLNHFKGTGYSERPGKVMKQL